MGAKACQQRWIPGLQGSWQQPVGRRKASGDDTDMQAAVAAVGSEMVVWYNPRGYSDAGCQWRD